MLVLYYVFVVYEYTLNVFINKYLQYNNQYNKVKIKKVSQG